MKEQMMERLMWSDGGVVSGRRGNGVARRSHRLRQAGFTLIEMMIVVLIIAVLAAIAWPSYTRYVTKTHRVAAQSCLSEYATYMERYYTTYLRYDKDDSTPAVDNTLAAAGLDCARAQSTGSNYEYGLSGLTPSTYTLTATPINAQLKRDTQCGSLTLDQTGARGASSTSGCW